MIIGLGTGRCGTVSLSKWLHIFHEVKPYPTPENLDDHLKKIEKTCKKWKFNPGDVSLGYIHVIEQLVETDHTLILLIRDRDEVANSLMNYQRGPHIWKKLFPEHDFDTLDGIKKYWDWYNERALQFESRLIVISPHQLPIKANVGMI